MAVSLEEVAMTFTLLEDDWARIQRERRVELNRLGVELIPPAVVRLVGGGLHAFGQVKQVVPAQEGSMVMIEFVRHLEPEEVESLKKGRAS